MCCYHLLDYGNNKEGIWTVWNSILYLYIYGYFSFHEVLITSFVFNPIAQTYLNHRLNRLYLSFKHHFFSGFTMRLDNVTCIWIERNGCDILSNATVGLSGIVCCVFHSWCHVIPSVKKKMGFVKIFHLNLYKGCPWMICEFEWVLMYVELTLFSCG